jgi:hypothetical protein
MAGYRRRYYQGGRRYTAEHRAALAHIEEARAFENAIGGSVKDVKQYFLGLDSASLGKLFDAYGARYGRSAADYARATFPKWRAGTTSMSGLVAKRLFDFLPPRMPTAIKLELAGNIWSHFGTRSSHYFTVGPNADVNDVMAAIQVKLDQYIVDHTIPEEIRNRFDWLSQGDVEVKEFLLNHFRRLDGKIAAEGLREKLPILQEQMHTHPEQTSFIKTSIWIHNHSIEIALDERLGSTFREGQPAQKVAPAKSGTEVAWLLIIVIAFFVLLILLSHHR